MVSIWGYLSSSLVFEQCLQQDNQPVVLTLPCVSDLLMSSWLFGRFLLTLMKGRHPGDQTCTTVILMLELLLIFYKFLFKKIHVFTETYTPGIQLQQGYRNALCFAQTVEEHCPLSGKSVLGC